MALEPGTYLTDGLSLFCFEEWLDDAALLEDTYSGRMWFTPIDELGDMGLRAVTPLEKGTETMEAVASG